MTQVLRQYSCFLSAASGRLQCACHIWISSVLIFTPRMCRSTTSDNAFGVNGLFAISIKSSPLFVYISFTAL